MQRSFFVPGAALALAASLFFTSSASAGGGSPLLEVAGTWTGAVRCKGLTPAGLPIKNSWNVTLRIAQSGAYVAVEIDMPAATLPPSGIPRGVGAEGNCGYSVANVDKPGKGAMMLSSHDATGEPYVSFTLPLESMLFESVKVYAPDPSGISGTMKGRGPIASWLAGAISNCSMKVQRTDVTPPTISPALETACFGI